MAAVWRRSVVVVLVSAVAASADDNATDTFDHHFGNIVPGRNVPPIPGCLATDKIHAPLTPSGADQYTIEHGWDWCMFKCKNAFLTSKDFQAVPCAHFTYFPDGKCYLQDAAAELKDDTYCNSEHPCSWNEEVITGPPSCDNTSLWMEPPKEAAAAVDATTTLAAPTTTIITEAPTTSALFATQEVKGVATIDTTDPSTFMGDAVAATAVSGALARIFSLLPTAVAVTLESDPENPSMVRAPFVATVADAQAEMLPSALDAANSGVLTTALKDELAVHAPTLATTYNVVSAHAFLEEGEAKKEAPVVITDVGEGAACNTKGKSCAEGLSCIGSVGSVDGICVVSLQESTTLAPTTTTPEPTTTTPEPTTTTPEPTTTTPEPTTTTPEPTTTTPEPTTTTVEPAPENGTIVGWYYEPHAMEGTTRLIAPNWRGCMEICVENPLCQHFGYWPDGGCQLQGEDAKLVKAVCPEGEETCPGLEVISGPRDLGMAALWPVIPASTTAAPSAATPMPATHSSPESKAPTEPKITQTVGGGKPNGHLPLFVTVGAAVLACVGFGVYQFMQGQSDDDDSDSSDSDDEESKMGVE